MAVIQAQALIAGQGVTAPSPSALIPATGVILPPTGFVTATLRAVVPLLTLPSQRLTVQLNGQSCDINVYQGIAGLYVDLGVNGSLVIGGVIAYDRNKIVRDPYLGFVGDIAFWDSQGTQDPDWTGLNQRYYLGYFYPT
jgi:hypothetical protein